MSVSRNDIPVTVKWPLDCHLTDTRLSMESHWRVTQLPLECQLTTNGMSLNCQWNVNRLSMECHSTATNWHSSDIRVTVQWKLNVTWVSLEFVCLFICLYICLFVCSSDIQVAFSDIRVTFQWHLSGTLLVVLVLSWVAVQWQSSDSQVTYQWLSSDSWVAIYWIGSTVAVNWQLSGRNLN